MAEQVTEEEDPPFDLPRLKELLDRQDGVVSRRQLLQLHARDHDIVRMLRRRELARVHDGVYVNHTGELSWAQRAWAVVLSAWPAALSHESALPKPPTTPIHVAVALGRTPTALPGVRFHRMADLEARVQWNRSPPRVRVSHAVIDVAIGRQRIDERFKVLADACQSRQTDVGHVRDALAERRRVPGRPVLLELLDDLAAGACSVLERGYLELERRHGLPDGDRQQSVAEGGRSAYLDVRYRAYALRVELDGRAFHDTAGARDADAERDLDGRVESDELTVRLTYGQVFGRGCATIQKVAKLLEKRGWSSTYVDCPDCEPLRV